RKVQVLPGPPGSKTAIVDIGLPRGTPRSTVQAMAAQLVWTLTSSAYSPALIQTVKLKINGRLWARAPGSSILSLDSYADYIPGGHGDENLYYVSANGAVRMFGQQAHSVAVPGQAGTSQVPLNKIAVSAGGHYLAGIAGPATTVYTEDLAAAAKPHASAAAAGLHSRLTGAGFSVPSWDSASNLWVAGRVHGSRGVWVIPSKGAAVRGCPPGGLGPGHRAQGRPRRGPDRVDRRARRGGPHDAGGDRPQRGRRLHHPRRAARPRPRRAVRPDLV